ncbi:MAG: hypothetical protein ACKOI2_03760 [Actinomycetota bacterium]
MSPEDTSAIAVLNGDADMMAIWHVAVEPVAQTARLCGAWVTDDLEVQRKVLASRKVVVFGDQTNDRIEALLSHTRGVIDLTATLVAIKQHICSVNDVHRASRTPKGSPRQPITWPVLPAMLDWGALPAVSGGVVEDPLISPTIAASRWIADLADFWSSIETTRTSRPHLAEENPMPVSLPFVLGTRSTD